MIPHRLVDTLVFVDAVTGQPQEPFEVQSEKGVGDEYFVDVNQRLVRRPRSTGISFRSEDATGSLLLLRTDHNIPVSRVVWFYNGLVTDMRDGEYANGFSFPPTWHHSAFDENGNLPVVERLLEMIASAAQGDFPAELDEHSRALLAIALCKPDLLLNSTPINAWATLDDNHLNALSAWARQARA